MHALPEEPSKSFAHELALAIEAKCLTYRDYIPWADNLIAQFDRPPTWICELSTVKYYPDALRIIRSFTNAEPFEQCDSLKGLYLGFLWIRFDRGELSWATFLIEAGEYSDCNIVGVECEYFYSMLSELEEAEFSASVEGNQRKKVNQHITVQIDEAGAFYLKIRKR